MNAIATQVTHAVQPLPPGAPRARVFSPAECQGILTRLAQAARGGGDTLVVIASDWVAGVRWGRNALLDTAETTDHRIGLARHIQAASSRWLLVNETSDAALVAALRRAERLVALQPHEYVDDVRRHARVPAALTPALYDDATAAVDGATRVAAAERMIQRATQAGLLSAGYLEVSAHSLALLDTLGHTQYFHYTWAQGSVTVRDPAGTGSGWAGVDWPAWGRLDVDHLAAVAQEKCLTSRHPVRVEPGRYTTILEPQAVFDFVQTVFGGFYGELRRGSNEDGSGNYPFWKAPGQSMLGDQIADARLTIGADPMDPDLGFPPCWPRLWEEIDYPIYTPMTVVKDGVLTTLPYDIVYGATQLGTLGRPWLGAFRMSGGTTSVAEMIASTTRGILVTHFDDVRLLETRSTLVRGYTRDGTWLIERGKISQPIVNLVATEAVLFALNNLAQLGVPQRIFNPPRTWFSQVGPMLPQPAIVPALQVKDFSFTALVDAV